MWASLVCCVCDTAAFPWLKHYCCKQIHVLALRTLARWQWGRECNDMNTKASGLISALKHILPLAVLMQRILRASVRVRGGGVKGFWGGFRVEEVFSCNKEDSSLTSVWDCYCFLWHLDVPLATRRLAWGLLSCPWPWKHLSARCRTLTQTNFSVTWERLL